MEFAGLFVQFVAATAVSMWHDTASNINTFGGTAGSDHVEAQDDEVRSHSNPEMTYHGGRWVLGDGEALVVTVHDPAERVPLLGTHHHHGLDGEPRLPVHHDQPEQPHGRALGRRRLAARDLADRSGRAQLARHEWAARGLHDRAMGTCRPSAAPDVRARADRQPAELSSSDLGRDAETALVVGDERPVLGRGRGRCPRSGSGARHRTRGPRVRASTYCVHAWRARRRTARCPTSA